MAREYVVSGDNLTVVSGPVMLAWINPSADRGLKILSCWVSFAANTSAARQRVQLVTQASSFPTLTEATPSRLRQSDDASVIIGATDGSAGTCGINASNNGSGNRTVIIADAMDVQRGWYWKFDQGAEIFLPANHTEGFGIYLPATPGTTTGWHCGILYREIGV